MKFSRDSVLAIGLVVVLGALTVLAGVQQTRQERLPPLSRDSAAPDGGLALWQWLREIGFSPSDAMAATFRVPPEASLALILEPTVTISDGEWTAIDDWVEAGGTLVLAGNQIGMLAAVDHYDFALAYRERAAQKLALQAPLFLSPPPGVPATVNTRAFLQARRADFVTHLAVPEGPVLVSFSLGAGRVFISAAPHALTNAGLKEPGNAELALNLLTSAPRGLAWFDEWHHGKRQGQTQPAGPAQWMTVAPAGQALLYVAGVIFLALVLRGRRFGRPVPLPRELYRRAPLEYITALANLKRRAGHRADVLHRYQQHLKRSLGQRYRLTPHMPDAQYVERLAAYDATIDAPRLLNLLERLARSNVSESEMIRLAAEVADWTKDT